MHDGCGCKVIEEEAAFQPEGPASGQADGEAGLIAAAKAGDYDAFEKLVNRSEKRIYRLVVNLTRNAEDAENLLQETFLKAFEHLGDFREDSRFHTWLVRFAINEGLLKLRQRRSGKAATMVGMDDTKGEALPREIADWQPDAEQILEQGEMRMTCERALHTLPVQHRLVFLLRDLEGCSTEETAEVLNLTVTTAHRRLHRARLRLREDLNKIFRQEEGWDAKKM